MRWDELFAAGMILSAHISKWSGKARITPDDLGIDDTPDVKRALALGSHKLLPSEAFEGVDQAARTVMDVRDRFGLRFCMVEGARFVPQSRASECMRELRKARDTFDAAVSGFVDAYEASRDAHLPTIESALRDAAKTSEAASMALDRVRNLYPGKEDVRGRFRVAWDVYAISSPQGEAAKQAAGEESEKIRSVVRDMVESLRTEITDRLADLVALASKGGALHGKTINATEATIARVESLNESLKDRALSDAIRTLRTLMEDVRNGKERGGKAGETATQGILPQLEATKKALAEGMDQAVKDAEATLTGLGKRKLDL